MERYAHKNFFWLFAALMISVFAISCRGPEPHPQKNFANVEVQINTESVNKLARVISTVNDITSIAVDIKDGEKILSHQELTKNNNIWSGSFEKLPTGIDLDFVANAYGDISDSNGLVAIFSGTGRKKLVAGSNTVTIPLAHNTAIDIFGFPDIAITHPPEILINSSRVITIAVADESDFITLVIISAGLKGFSPEAGVINLVSGLGSIDASYHAPAIAGVYDYTVVATNKKGNSTSRIVRLNVVDKYSNYLSVDFSPVITQISISLNGSDLTFTATVVDDKPLDELKYAWSFDGNLSFVNDGVNPAILANYVAGEIGVISLTVIDAGGGISRFAYNLTNQSFENTITLIIGVSDTGYDVVIDKDATFSGDRACNTLLVKNNAIVTFTGSVFCNDIVVRNGKATINGNLNAVNATTLETNTMNTANVLTVKGSGNSAQTVEIFSGSTLNMLGDWHVNNWLQRSGSKAQVIPYSTAQAGSGIFVLRGDNLTVESGAVLNADGAGADPRGAGGGYAGSGGGAYGGDGCGGYWSATHAGSAFGYAYSFIINMGSAGGVYGGGKIFIELIDKATIAGSITSNGNYLEDRAGGGSGGGILINASSFEITGTIETNGGRGGYYGGGGGGGRIKLFYKTGIDGAVIINHLKVAGGLRGGYLNTCNGSSGTMWVDAIPGAPSLLTPDNGASVSASPSFSLAVSDDSATNDGRDDDLSVVLEISTDNFATTFKTYDQTKDLNGWSKLSYKTGDTATFTMPDTLPLGNYQWRVYAVDRSIAGEPSAIRTFIVL